MNDLQDALNALIQKIEELSDGSFHLAYFIYEPPKTSTGQTYNHIETTFDLDDHRPIHDLPKKKCLYRMEIKNRYLSAPFTAKLRLRHERPKQISLFAISKEGQTGFKKRLINQITDKQDSSQLKVDFPRVLIIDVSHDDFSWIESAYMALYGSLAVAFPLRPEERESNKSELYRKPDGVFWNSPELSAVVWSKLSLSLSGDSIHWSRVVFPSDNESPLYPLNEEELALFGRVENPDQPSFFQPR